MDALETARDHRFHAEQLRALGRPVAARPGAVFLAAEDDRRRAFGHVAHRRVVDEHFLAGRLKQRDAAFFPRTVGLRRNHQVLDADIGERAAHHHVVVTAARPVRIEVGALHAVVLEPDPGGRAFLDRAGRRDVVGGDRVTEERHRPGAVNARRHRGRCHRERLEEGRLRDVSRTRPGVDLPRDAFDAAPEFAGLRLHLFVVAAHRRAVHRMAEQCVHLVAGRPDVAQVDVAAPRALADGFGRQVLRDRAGDRVGDDERRAREEVGLQVRVDARLEIAVARQHGGAHQVALRDRLVDLGRQVAGIADAGRAAVSGDIEAESLEIGQQAGLLQVFGDHARARRERSLDVRRDLEAGFDRLLREQAGAEHHARVRRVRA